MKRPRPRPRFRARVVEQPTPFDFTAWLRQYLTLVLEREGYTVPAPRAEAS